MSRPKPVALIILDGFALRDETHGNAVAQANKPNFDRYWNEYPHTTLTASGEQVGLPEGQMGNSEVGHLNIGAGRIVYQDLTRISKSITDGDFYENEVLLAATAHVKSRNKKLHLCGLLSDGGVHSHIDHVIALLKLAKQEEVQDVYLHLFLDGRDVSPDSAKSYLQTIGAAISELKIGTIASVHGRYYAMDRDKRWDRTEKTYRTMAYADGKMIQDPEVMLNEAYAEGIYDEFIEPVVLDEAGKVNSEDAVIFFNFRPDRAIQLSQAFTQIGFDGFDRGDAAPQNLHFVCLTSYSETVQGNIAFPPKDLQQTFGDVVSEQGLKQLRIAETEKYPHVTFFFNGGQDVELPGETRILIPSPKVATYDLKPEMSAYEISEAVVKEIKAEKHDTIILNFANPDMVGHSGKMEPTIRAVEVTDECLGQVVEAIVDAGGVAVITADHGNADVILDEQDRPITAHTTNPVPFIVTKKDVTLREDGILADIAPTLLALMQIEQPSEMTGRSIIL